MRNYRLLLALFFLILHHSFAFSQASGYKIVDSFNNVTLVEFFSRLEKKVPYKFYYQKTELDSFLLRLEVNGLTLPGVLEKAFTGTDIYFAIDEMSGNIYITRRVQLVTMLPDGMFARRGEKEAGAGLPADTFTDFDIETRAVAKAVPGKLIEIGEKSGQTKGNIILTGYIRNTRTGEPISNASVYVDSVHATITDAYGHYSLMMPAGNRTLNVQTIGMRDLRLQLAVYSNGNLDVGMEEQVRVLKEVIVSNRKTSNIRNVQMGMEKLSIANIRKVPTVFGETDVLRVITSLPGVKTVGEASTGFNVRGGSTDQNLILFNDATIYNPSHFFGMFSAFNPEVIKDIELYKSSMPASYGGRLSSVLDITSREGNKKNLTGSAGIGLVTSRVHLEGPITKDKTSFIFGGRTTYANWMLNLLPDEYKNSKASFQDADFSISHRVDSNNYLYFSGYFSRDKFSLNSDTAYGYSNRNASFKWRHNFTNKFRGVFVAGYDQYVYRISSEANKVNAYNLGFNIEQFNLKVNFDYYVNSSHAFDFGLSTIRYKLHPGFLEPSGSESIVQAEEVETEQAQESAIYLTHRFSPGARFSLSTGLRYSIFNYLGPQQVSIYAPGLPITEANQTGTIDYSKGKIIKTWYRPELRISARYSLSPTFSFKAAFNTLNQYIHLLSNTTIIAPTDIWKLSDPNIKPQRGGQVSFGMYKNLKSNTIETSAEIYYKKIEDYLDYKPGASLFLNHHIETDVINTRGKAYGIEVLVKKTSGKLNGWISYTYSRILLQAYDSVQGISVNNGNYYPANYDKPHDVTLAGNFAINHRVSISLNSTYSTGRPITLPVGRFNYVSSQRVLYSDRNAYRIPDYFRADLALNVEGNHKVHQKTHNSWTFGVYNLTGRKNPYSVYFVSENGVINGYKISIFGSVIPFVNFNIRF